MPKKRILDRVGPEVWKSGSHAGKPVRITFYGKTCRRHGDLDKNNGFLGLFKYPKQQRYKSLRLGCVRCEFEKRVKDKPSRHAELSAWAGSIEGHMFHDTKLPALAPIEYDGSMVVENLAPAAPAEAEEDGALVVPWQVLAEEHGFGPDEYGDFMAFWNSTPAGPTEEDDDLLGFVYGPDIDALDAEQPPFRPKHPKDARV